MIQCTRCGTTLLESTLYCYKCGASMNDRQSAMPQPAIATTPEFSAPQPPMSGVPSMEAGWAEFSGMQAPIKNSYPPMPTVPGTYGPVNSYPPVYPPAMPAVPGVYGPVGNYPYAPGMVPPPMTPAPKRQGMSLGVMLLLGLLVALLIFGGVFIGVHVGQAHNGTAQTQATPIPTTPPTPDQLYKQVTSQAPTFADSLQDPATSSWGVFDKTTYSCQIQQDGLHVYIRDTDSFTYCTSGLGKFNNAAFQIDMKILSGDGGGLILRGDTTAGNLYYFHVLPDGSYHIYVEKNHQLTILLSGGTISSFTTNQRNTLTTIAQGNQLYFYVNQKLLTTLKDSTYTNGYMGVLSNCATAAAEVVYTNAKIWRL